MYTEDEFLQLSGIQHFSFCRRQWALIHVEQQWEENILTAEGRVEHCRVHDSGITDKRNGKLTIRGLKIHSHELGISGECDAVEFSPTKDGITLYGKIGQWLVTPIEYKHGNIKISDCDRLQVTIQAMCLEEMFHTTIEEGALFFISSHRRLPVLLDEALREQVRQKAEALHQMRKVLSIPAAQYSAKCKRCSLREVCMPKVKRSAGDYCKALRVEAEGDVKGEGVL